MRIPVTLITCDEPGCTEKFESHKTGGRAFLGTSWVTGEAGDYCPQHAPNEFECGVCGAAFPRLHEFDQHIRRCKR